ncbi:scavenger receptor cysteine-rich domain-containing protein DMBT1-like [Carettochelys insculpta]|uniref:scavenger receptor cysteine-rich domain-containing protein DMBT1-like n=1 Tax=Carettochelys insculpta TaxID=44489 RepID=UPI003EB7092B
MGEFHTVMSGHIKPRLVGGEGACSGRVEVIHGNTWATVCDAHFDLHAANVICNELQCGVAASLPGGAHFGEGQGQIWTERFQCVGNESLLFSCPRIPPENQTCSHAKDAGAICSRFRLVNGSTECSGRVELQVLGDWGTLCDSRWDLADANVLCHQLDCGFAVSAPGGGYFGKGTGSVWKDTFHCNGNEPHLWRCPVTALGPSQCSHDNDASVVCSGRLESLRLRNGESRCDGRVEISLGGVWSRVLDEQWDMTDASVVCRALQCGVAEKAYNPPKSERGTGPVGLRRVQCVGNETHLTLCNNSVSETAQAGIAEDVSVVCSGSGQIWLDDVNCTGNESELWECPSRGWGQHNCRHKEDAGVLCSEFTDLRLVSGSDCAGRLEVFYNGTWGSVCSNQMSTVTAVIVCKQLHCGDGGYIAGDSTYGEGSGPTWLDRVQCSEQHSSLWQCPSEPWNAESCDDRREETHITCTGNKTKPTLTPVPECPNSTSCTDQEKLRLVGGEDRCSGRVEIWYRGSWGRICDDSWDMADANVVCKQLDCGAAVSALGEAAFGEGTGPIWVETLHCRGTESSLWDCPARPWGESDCYHKEDAAVNCSGVTAPAELRLVNGGSPCAGRVEVKHQDQWGTVCDDGWDVADAGVVCKQLRCGSAVNATVEAHFGQGSGKTWLGRVACRGTESAVWNCENSGWDVSYCDHTEDAGVVCSGHTKPRLVGGHSACSGRVEIRNGEVWNTVCDSHFDLKAASVVCNELQCGAALSVKGGAHFGEGCVPIWTEAFQCKGNESHHVYCARISRASQTCSHANDAGVICSWLTGFRLVNGGSECSGRVEVQVRGDWRTLCDSGWDLADANVLCHRLDCGFAVSAPGGGYFGKGTGLVWTDSFHCKGIEPHLGYCPVTPLGASQCSHDNDASVICSASPHHPPSDSGRVTGLVVVCIALGALLCLVLILLGVQVRSARAQRRGTKPLDPFPEAVYEEIDYNLKREKQEMFSGSVSNSDDSLRKLQYYSEGENDPGSEQETPALPADAPGHGYDDAREVPHHGDDPGLGQNSEEDSGENDRNRDSQTDCSLHFLRNEDVSGMKNKAPLLPPGETSYDDVGHGDSGESVSDPFDRIK